MERSVQNWFRVVKNIYSSVLLMAIAGVVSAAMVYYTYLCTSGCSLMVSVVENSFFQIIKMLAHLSFIAGCFLYFLNLGNLGLIVGNKEMIALRYVRIGVAIITLSAILLMFGIPSWSSSMWIAVVLNIPAYVIMMVGFHTIYKSPHFSERPRKGFRVLFVSMLCLALVSVFSLIFGWVPYIGAVISIVFNLAGFVLMIIGWYEVRHSSASVA